MTTLKNNVASNMAAEKEALKSKIKEVTGKEPHALDHQIEFIEAKVVLIGDIEDDEIKKLQALGSIRMRRSGEGIAVTIKHVL